MTQITNASGHMVPVTVIETGSQTVTKVLKKDKEGYDAVQLGFGDVKPERLNQAIRKSFEKGKLPFKKVMKEFRLNNAEEASQFKLGQEIGADLFEEGEFVDIQGRTIGKGFQGSIKRWKQSRGPESHGSMYHRRPGSAGASSYPSRTWPGQHMPGRMGGKNRTMQNLLVLKVMKEDNAILVKGAVPGAKNGLLTIHKSLKKSTKLEFTKDEMSKGDQQAAAAKKIAKARKK